MNHKSNDVLGERKQFYKTLLSPTMSIEDKMDELWDVPKQDLIVLLEQFEVDDDYEIWHAIKAVLDKRNIEVGDIVSYWEIGKMKYSWLTVLEINGEEATCSINVIPENMDEAPASLDKMAVNFNLADLRLVKKN